MVENARNKKGLWAVIVRELHRLVSRPIYLLSMVAFPLFTGFLLLSLMKSGYLLQGGNIYRSPRIDAGGRDLRIPDDSRVV